MIVMVCFRTKSGGGGGGGQEVFVVVIIGFFCVLFLFHFMGCNGNKRETHGESCRWKV
jgi:heme/copper-type cytochrome/quinol oxidase subunit 1